MSTRLVDAATRLIDSRVSRRGFLRRAAIVGTALVAAPTTYVLRPGTAYGAVIPSDCPPGALCRDGWTDFCCSFPGHGTNTCPPGAVVGGWWRAEGNTFCNGNSRYYMDCHSTNCTCRCNNDDCGQRRVCCSGFRYGQCNQHLTSIGPIICRVVTCVTPWHWDSSCTTTDASAQETYNHDAACLHPDMSTKGPYPAQPAVFSGPSWSLRNSLSSGSANSTFNYGLPGDHALMADWSNSGVMTPAVVRGARRGRVGQPNLLWYIRQVEGAGEPSLVIRYGRPGDIPVAGDWNGNGVATIGVVRGNRWLLRNQNSPGSADHDFTFGQPGDIPVVGDWNGDGRTRIGMVRGNRWLLRNSLSSGSPHHDFTFGSGDGTPVTGDWNGNGSTGVGWFQAGQWSIRNLLSSGSPDSTFTFGSAGGIPATWGRIV